MNYTQLSDTFRWQLDVNDFELSDRECDLLYAADMLQERSLSIRQCARDCGIAKSVLHSFINDGRLKRISYELYQLCRKQLEWNKNHISYFVKNRR